MPDFEVKNYENSPEEFWQIIRDAFSIESVVERAAYQFCMRNAEYFDFQCFAREVGAPEWQEFGVEVQIEPVFYATKTIASAIRKGTE